MRTSMICASLIAAGLALGSEAKAEPNYRFIYSPQGPGAGEGVLGFGGRVYIFVPTFDVNYVRGFTDDLDLTLNINTLGIITFGDIGVRYRLLGGADQGFALGVRAAVTPIVFFIGFGEGAAAGAAIGATPGIVASFGGKHTQFSIGFDAPIFFGGAGIISAESQSASASGFDPLFTGRPFVAIEFPVGDTVSMYIQASGIIAFEDALQGFFGPLIGIGAMF